MGDVVETRTMGRVNSYYLGSRIRDVNRGEASGKRHTKGARGGLVNESVVA